MIKPMASEKVFSEMPTQASRILLASAPMSLDESYFCLENTKKPPSFFTLHIKCVLSLDMKSVPLIRS